LIQYFNAEMKERDTDMKGIKVGKKEKKEGEG
jgi:hypothetical protein